MSIARNTATYFALAGAVIAGIILLAVFGWYWVLLPGATGAVASMYFVSTGLGAVAKARAQRSVSCIFAGVGVAIATFGAGVVGLGIPNVFLAWLEDVTEIRTGMGPYYSLLEAAEDYLFKPLVWGSLFGWPIVLFLGVLYGSSLYRGQQSKGS